MCRIAVFLVVVLLAVSLLLTLAVICDYFEVYIPGISYFIPERFRPSRAEPSPSLSVSPRVTEEVIIMEQNTDSPEPEREQGK